jgi:hypothetical protein
MPRRPLTFNGRTQSIAAWAREFNLSATTLRTRLERGIPLEVALTMGRARGEIWIDHGGVRRRLADVCRETGVPCHVAACRIGRGMDPDRAVATPPATPAPRMLTCGGKTRTIAAWVKDRRVRRLGLTARTILHRVRRGWGDEAVLTTPPVVRTREVVYQGEVIRVGALARRLGISRSALDKRIQAGKPEATWGDPVTRWADPRRGRRGRCQVLIEAARAGTLHPSVRLRFKPYRVHHRGRWVALGKLCERHGITMGTMTWALAHGRTIDEALATDRRLARIEHDGATHTWAEWAALTGIAVGTLRARARAGWPTARILTTPAAPPGFAYVTYHGERRRLKDLAREKKISIGALRNRIGRGATIEEALDG